MRAPTPKVASKLFLTRCQKSFFECSLGSICRVQAKKQQNTSMDIDLDCEVWGVTDWFDNEPAALGDNHFQSEDWSSMSISLKEWRRGKGLRWKEGCYRSTKTCSRGVSLCSSVASPISQEGHSERNFPIFAFPFRFFLFFPDFPSFFPDFFPIFGKFSLSGVALCPPLPPQWLRHWAYGHWLMPCYLWQHLEGGMRDIPPSQLPCPSHLPPSLKEKNYKNQSFLAF